MRGPDLLANRGIRKRVFKVLLHDLDDVLDHRRCGREWHLGITWVLARATFANLGMARRGIGERSATYAVARQANTTRLGHELPVEQWAPLKVVGGAKGIDPRHCSKGVKARRYDNDDPNGLL